MILKAWRKWRKRRFIKVLERQMDRLHAREAPGGEIEALRARILRARKQLSQMAVLVLSLSQAACAHDLTVGALETATIVTSEALAHCEASTSAKPGDASADAQRARAECLRIPDFQESADAAGALADELHAARQWVKTGHPH